MLQSSIYLFSFNLKAYRKINLQALSSPSLMLDMLYFQDVEKCTFLENPVKVNW